MTLPRLSPQPRQCFWILESDMSKVILGKTSPMHVSFIAGNTGAWKIDSIIAATGDGLPAASRLNVVGSSGESTRTAANWVLRGVTSNTRYTTRSELAHLEAIQAGLGRDQAVSAALIPIRKTPTWWALAQDERRAIIEDQSRHIAVGLKYLPAIARRLYHSRELEQPFDFLTWFEYAPEDSAAFEELVGELRRTVEWTFVDREIDIRLSRLSDRQE